MGPGAAWQSSGLTQQCRPGKRKFPTLSLVFRCGYVVHGTQTVSVQNIQAATRGKIITSLAATLEETFKIRSVFRGQSARWLGNLRRNKFLSPKRALLLP